MVFEQGFGHGNGNGFICEDDRTRQPSKGSQSQLPVIGNSTNRAVPTAQQAGSRGRLVVGYPKQLRPPRRELSYYIIVDNRSEFR